MKKLIIVSLLCLTIPCLSVYAQNGNSGEKYGKTLNLGLGIGGYSGYYGYVGRSIPVVNINYEFDVARNFTLAPFVSFYSYTNSYYWGDNSKNHPFRNYSYRETVIPIGVKGTYYLDGLLNANSNWDFYLGGSAGFALVNSSWENGYDGDKNHFRRGSSLFLDLHAGAEYHFNNRLGAFLDLSTGVTTIGLAIH